MLIGLGQFNTTVGDLMGNAARIREYALRAQQAGCGLLVTPELALTGYPPQDLLLKEHFITEQLSVLHDTVAPHLAVPALVGFADRDEVGRRYNAAALIVHGAVQQVVHKTLLPTYDVFDELRYFTPATDNQPLQLGNHRLGVTICEDIWDARYERKVVPRLVEQGATVLINLSSSPFHAGKREVRIERCRSHALAHNLPVLYCNGVGAQDELIFDGESLAVNARGELAALGAQFGEDLVVVDCRTGQEPPVVALPELHREQEVFHALKLGIADYFRKCGFSAAVLGLSGGIDSAVAAVLAVEALGADNVICVAMPSRFTAGMSNEDAQILAAKLGCEFHSMAIEESVKLAMARFTDEFGDYAREITVENLQARERGKILMEISNDRNALVLATGNKTEYALGYSTLYGDMCGGLAVIGDVSKPEVYALARYYNTWRGAQIIPQRIIERPPSAELRADQIDPFDYERISPLVDAVIEEHAPRDELIERGYSAAEVERVFCLVRLNEYKRRQAPPVLRVTEKAFGIGRKMPIVNKYEW